MSFSENEKDNFINIANVIGNNTKNLCQVAEIDLTSPNFNRKNSESKNSNPLAASTQ